MMGSPHAPITDGSRSPCQIGLKVAPSIHIIHSGFPLRIACSVNIWCTRKEKNLLISLPTIAMLVWVGGYLFIYLSLSPSDLVSTVIARPRCNCLIKKINQVTDVFTHKHTELPTSSFSIVPCSVCSQALCTRLVNYIDQQFFIVTKPQDKNSLNWPVGSGHSRLGLQIYFFIMKKLSALTTGMEGELGYVNKMGYI